MRRKDIKLYDDEVDVWEDARAVVEADTDAGIVDATSERSGQITDGQVLRVLAEAYLGRLE